MEWSKTGSLKYSTVPPKASTACPINLAGRALLGLDRKVLVQGHAVAGKLLTPLMLPNGHCPVLELCFSENSCVTQELACLIVPRPTILQETIRSVAVPAHRRRNILNW
jgi:hypothetical protein